MKVVGITQARIGSSRLPGKVLLRVGGKSLLEHHLTRAQKARSVDSWILATTNEPNSEAIVSIGNKLKIPVYQGSTDNVLDRFYKSLNGERPDYVVRITSDCPLIDAEIIDLTVKFCIENRLNYFYSSAGDSLPDGLDTEVFTFEALEEAWKHATSKGDLEHVTRYIQRKNASTNQINYPVSWQKYRLLRLTVDEQNDFELIKNLIDTFGAEQSWLTYANAVLSSPQLASINQHIMRNAGALKGLFEEIKLRSISNFSKSDEYRSEIHKLIPGGAHTYSKGDDQFPERAPAAIEKGKGAYLWDIDGNQYLDCSMSLTAVTLGHAFEPIIERTKIELENGVNFQRPSFLEKEMAEVFLSLVPGHDMIKFAKNGSTVTTAAVKLARAKTGRKLVAFPGDHPFYSYDDWFIGKTVCNKGVPDEISNLSVTFKSCDIASLRALFQAYPGQIACVITEPEKNHCGHGCTCGSSPEQFLKEAIELTHQNGALFILDEMITGFKTDFPGSITKYNLKPDMATWGKGIANGFSFCALTGTKEVMEQGSITIKGAEKVFLISSTHGGETHTIAAALATIDFYKKNNVVKHLHRIGKLVIDISNHIIQQKSLEKHIQVVPCEWMPVFVFLDNNLEPSQSFRTLLMQEMFSMGVLFQGIFVPSYSHKEEDIYYFAKAFDQALDTYKRALDSGFEKMLVGEPAKAVFRKYI
jgi:glutamate-1-semialdehyde aminotransferase/spore coat polysaccharide biosynthesis protein SpsF (cytidylyltransferase family)